MTGKFLKAILGICCLAFFFSSSSVQASGDSGQINGPVRYSSGDNPSWSSPSYNDAAWNRIDNPALKERILPRDMTWYRIRFLLPHQTWKDPAILINPSSGADEIFLNGVKIGGEGTIGARFVGAPKVARLCRIPANLINSSGDNLLALRVMASRLEGERFSQGIRVGEYGELRMKKLDRGSLLKKIELMVMVCMLIPLGPFLILLFNRTSYRKGMENFGIFIILFVAVYFIGGLVFYETGLKTYLLERVRFGLLALLPLPIPFLFIYFFREKITLYLKILVLSALSLGLLMLFAFRPGIFSLYKYGWIFLVVSGSLYLLRLGIQGYRRKIPEMGIMLVGIVGLVTADLYSAFEALNILPPIRVFYESLTVLGGPFFIFLRMSAISRGLIKTKQSQLSLSKRILTAHEEERMRLARELHDGLGQSLLAVKLGLQVAESKVRKGLEIESESLTGIISEISHSIDELRRISMDLRPASFERVPFGELIRWYAEKCQKDTSIRVTVEAEEGIEVPSKKKDHLYRILQEALTNAIKHAGPSEIGVRLKRLGNGLCLQVKDNGKGFDYQKQDKQAKGIGLSTIKERVELLEGNIRIDSSQGKGTAITIEVPIK